MPLDVDDDCGSWPDSPAFDFGSAGRRRSDSDNSPSVGLAEEAVVICSCITMCPIEGEEEREQD